MSNETCIICGQGHDEQEEVNQSDGSFYHKECYSQAEVRE